MMRRTFVSSSIRFAFVWAVAVSAMTKIGVAGHRGVEGVEDDRALESSAWRVGDDIDPSCRPRCEAGRWPPRAERVGGGEDDAPTLALVARSRLPMIVVLPVPLTPTTRMTAGPPSTARARLPMAPHRVVRGGR